MVRLIAGLAVALFGAAHAWGGELDGDFAGKASKAQTVGNETANRGKSASGTQVGCHAFAAHIAADKSRESGLGRESMPPIPQAKGSELDSESPTQASRWGGGRGWGGGWGRGWGGWGRGGWGWGRGWGWGGWGRGWYGYGGWGWGRGWYASRGWGWGWPYYASFWRPYAGYWYDSYPYYYSYGYPYGDYCW
jgi:hypothetical protein